MKRDKPRLRLFPKRGYILLLVGILIGFLLFSLITFIFARTGVKVIEFLYTSEKQSWIEEVTPKFERQYFEETGERIYVKLTVTGTHDSATQILWGNVKPVIWSPAASIWIPYINLQWQKLGYQGKIALDDWKPLVLSPVVIAGWKSLFEQFNITSFRDLYQLAKSAEWFKFGHPDPRDSNGGTMAVVLEFAEAARKKPEELKINDFKDESVLEFVSTLESKSVYYGKSTGFFGKWAAENGPLSISFFSVYENVVLDSSLTAQKKWGDSIVAIYPKDGTLMVDHPFVILNAPWVGKEEREVAEQYLSFLLNEENQRKAQQYGFRPVNPNVSLDTSIFNEANGVQEKIPVPILDPLPGEALDALFTVWTKVKNPGV